MAINKHTIYLFFAGAILISIGSYIGFLPFDYLTQFFNKSELSLDSLSEIRGMGGSLFTAGIFLLSGALVKRIENTALILSALIYGSFSAFRMLGIILDGVPSQSIIIALTIEVVFTAIAFAMLLVPKSEGIVGNKRSKGLMRH